MMSVGGILAAGLRANSNVAFNAAGPSGSAFSRQAALTNLFAANPQPKSLNAKPASSAAAQLFNETAGLVRASATAPTGLAKALQSVERSIGQSGQAMFSSLLAGNNAFASSVTGNMASLKDHDANAKIMSLSARATIV